MIGSLQSLRGIFAIMIFLHHFPINGKGWFDAGGPCGVDFFLILSGFVLCVGYENKVLSSDFHYRHFIFKRLIRVYPLHIFLSTLASRYVFAHNEVYHIKASVFAKNWCFLNFFLK